MSGSSVVVLGSGAAGLAAALAARAAGASTLVLERADAVGGTTAMSGGVVWAPGNHLLEGDGDDVAAAVSHVHDLDPTGTDPELVRAFAGDAGRVVTSVEELTSLEWEALATWPDYRAERHGGRRGGRSIWPRATAVPRTVAARVQGGPPDEPFGAAPGTAASTRSRPAAADDGGGPGGAPASDAVVFRGPARGRVLIAALLAALEEAGAEVRTGARVTDLVLDDGRVAGVRVGAERIDGRVVLAGGGFQHDAALTARHLGAGVAPMGPPGCAGDGVRLALSAGAALGSMAEAWWMPALHIPGERFEGRDLYRPLHGERAQPGALMVDGRGRRFVNEGANYGDVGRAMQHGAEDGHAGPYWLVFGRCYRERYPVGPLRPDTEDPDWLRGADDVAGLAAAIDVPGDALAATLARFDEAARQGRDPDFGRGDRPYERWIGDPGAPHPTLAPVGPPPYYALAVHLGCLGTKGGPRTDDCGRVVGPGGTVPGLYAAGNAAASPFGRVTVGGGATLGPALVFGWRAGEAAVADR